MNLKLVATCKGLIDDTATEVGNLIVIQVWKRYGDWQGDLARAGQEQLSLDLAG